MKARSLPPTGRRPSLPTVRGPVESTAATPFVAWEEWFRRAPIGSRTEMLALADRQGFLSLHQLPPIREAGLRETSVETGLLRQLIAGQTTALPIVSAERTADPARAALVRLRATPDLCLWRRRSGDPAASSLIARALSEALDDGRRVLYVGPILGSLERTLTELAESASFLAVRFVGDAEKAANGPLTRFGLAEQRQSLRLRLLSEAQDACAVAVRTRQRREAEAHVWAEMTDLVGRRPSIAKHRDDLADRLARIEVEVRREAQSLRSSDRMFPSGPFAVDFGHRLSTHQQRKTETQTKLQMLQRQSDAFALQIEDVRNRRRPLEALVAARSEGRWWTPDWWRATLRGAELKEYTRLDDVERSAKTELERVRVEFESAQQTLQADHDRLDREVMELIDAEILRRRTELRQQLAEAEAGLRAVDDAWNTRLSALQDSADRPTEPSIDAVAAARARWLARQATEESGRSFVDEWNRYLAEGIDALLDRLPRLAPVLVGTTAALVDNADFAAAVAGGDFDLVVIDDADGLGEAELSRLSELAPRSLLVGAAEPVDVVSCSTRATPFQKLWHLLHPTNARPVYAWSSADGTVCCTLHKIEPADAGFVESERLADFPEIELRILARPGIQPRLAQIVFPATLRLAEVKSFIYRELQEAAIDRLDRPCRWHETETSFVLQLSDEHTADCSSVELEPGLCESACSEGGDWTTCRLTFAKDAGWTSVRVQEWCRRYLGFVDTGRTADLG
jgi:hypothetical protein